MMRMQNGLADWLHHRIGANNGIDANDRRDTNHRSDMNDRGDVDNWRDVGAGHRRRRDQQQCGSDEFSHGPVVPLYVQQIASGAIGVGRARRVGLDNVFGEGRIWAAALCGMMALRVCFSISERLS
jgi:hypothetical protein